MPHKTTKLHVTLFLSSGLSLEQWWDLEGMLMGELPEALRGQVEIPGWLDNPQRRELPDGTTQLRGDVQSGHEADAAHWLGLE